MTVFDSWIWAHGKELKKVILTLFHQEDGEIGDRVYTGGIDGLGRMGTRKYS